MSEKNGKTRRWELSFPDNLPPRLRRIYDLLADGERHTKQEIKDKCIDDELAAMNNVKEAMKQLRNRLPPERIIVCECAFDVIYYRMVCPLFPNYVSPREQLHHLRDSGPK